MPELPEVENIAQGLRHEILKCGVTRMQVIQPAIIRFPRNWRKITKRFVGDNIEQVARRAKRLIIAFTGGGAILIQLGMTGKVLVADADAPVVKHTHVRIRLSNGREVRLIDPRRFGRVWFFAHLDSVHPDAEMEAAGMGRLGPEPFDVTPKKFREILQSSRAVKTHLLDQSRIAGLGNIYADESLFAAGIHPATPAAAIPPAQADKLCRTIKSILRRAIRHGGTTLLDYRNAYGEMGRFLKMLKVYQRTGRPCHVCHTPIQRLVLGGRSSHYCPKCQPLFQKI
ncbi:MAG: bifunctional DNA-formamidopyrimidine glycosylase/DNA-(apurinic or apyrimidinic site) lyase [Sedimentisphaerales bacterium]|nr:bifunctional DNA-formamidopyrimidine glycosylase/DNA-(apurinic or apyrimidinic site) lyase [Sedimentisphaerales bacterium]